MSDSETAPQGGAETSAEPAVTTPETTAPVESGAVTETTEQADPDKPAPEKERHAERREERRVAAMSARLAEKEAERQRLAQEVEYYRRQFAPQPAEPQLTPEQQAAVDRAVEAKLAQHRAAERAEAFHAEGKKQYPDWGERCQNLMNMGADAAFAELLLETPGGAKVAGALADDPEALERISGLKSERARAIALGQYAATLEDKPAAPPRTRAPAPIKPIGGTSARTEFDPYGASLTPNQLVDFFTKQAMQKRGL